MESLRPRSRDAAMDTNAADPDAAPLVVAGATVVTLDGDRREIGTGHVVVHGNRITAVGEGPAPSYPGARVVDGRGCLVTPGLVNTHQHLYQWVTRGLAADATLFEWLTTLYPVWSGIDEEAVHVAAQAALARLAFTGCTTAADHHYVFPREGGDPLGAEILAAADVGLRFHPARGSMDLSRKDGGLPPDSVVQDRDEVLAATEAAIARWHDPEPGSMLRLSVAPCSPFSVSGGLMREAAELARHQGVRLHTHLAETVDEAAWCRRHFGCTPLEYAEQLGWTGPDVWFAHGIHFDDVEVKRLGGTATGVAHCPSSNARLGAGIARAADLREAGSPVGLGVDGAASNEAGSLLEEVRHAVLFARARGGPRTLGVRAALEMATLDGARILGREDEIGSLEVGKLADLAVWRLDTLAHAGIEDPVAALVLGTPPPLELLLVDGRPVVEHGRVVTVDETALAARVAKVQQDLVRKAG
jgi:cytosine/adenosine deaminase-related metal-dependent hydrolase